MVNYWAVNQGKTYKDEYEGQYLWAPIANKAGSSMTIYNNLKLVKKNDIVFSIVKGKVYGVGVCKEEYKEFENPLTQHKNDWINEGWLIKVDFEELDNKPSIKSNLPSILPLLPKKCSPILQNGNAPQSGYLSSISGELADVFMKMIGNQYNSIVDTKIDDGIQGRIDIGYTVKQQLVNSRRGQGQFKSNVLSNEKCCRLTGISDIRFLVASHIKPWSKSTDEEKLDGCNGFLLSPNADRLFDRGFISFTDDGSIMVSSRIEKDLCMQMGIQIDKNVGKFNRKQMEYLDYHRKNVFIN